MNFLTVGMRVLLICHVIVTSRGREKFEEHRCSKYDFEERVLEKVLRFEIALESVQTKFDVLADELKKQQTGLTEDRNQFLQDLQSVKDDVVSDVQKLKEKTQDQVARIVRDAQEILNKTGPVSAFTVKVPAGAPTTHGISGVVLFTTTVYDASDDYDVTTGVFTCRHAGVYFFALSLVKYKTGTIDGYIYKGSEALLRAYVRASIAETSAFVTTKLVPGDAIFVGGGTGVTGMSTYSAFSGFLVTTG